MKTRTGTIRSVNLDGDADPAISASASASIGGGAQSLKILGSVSGVITIQGAANAGTYTLTMPTDDGTIAGQALLTDGAGGLSWAGVGTVTTVSVTTANGVSASVANATTTPALTFTLGAITPSTVQGLTITTTTGTFTLTNAKTFSVSNTLTLAGTDGSTLNVGAGGTLGTLAFQSGTFSGTSSGTNTGDQTTIAGNAGSATILQTARTINGTSFNGSTNITVTADASTLSGTTLNYTVLASSLTSVGTLASLAVYSATEIDFWCDANIDLECAGTFIVEAGVAFSAAAQAVSLFTGSTITMSGQPNGTALTLDDSAQTVGITAANGLTLNGGQIAPLSAVLQAIQDEGAVSGPGKINLGNTIDSAVMDGSITMGSDAIITFTVGGTGINFFGASALISNVSGTSGTVLSSNGDGSSLTGITYSQLGTAAVADGGTGRTTSTTAYGLIAAGTTATGAHQTLPAGATTEILVGAGASALPVWTTATGSGEPVRGTTPTFKTSVKVNNPANTFAYTITPAAIAAARTLNLPLITGTDTLAALGLAQTWSATQTFGTVVGTVGSFSSYVTASNIQINGANSLSRSGGYLDINNTGASLDGIKFYTNNGTVTALTIAPTTGAMSLVTPLGVASGGTSASTVAGAQTALSVPGYSAAQTLTAAEMQTHAINIGSIDPKLFIVREDFAGGKSGASGFGENGMTNYDQSGALSIGVNQGAYPNLGQVKLITGAALGNGGSLSLDFGNDSGNCFPDIAQPGWDSTWIVALAQTTDCVTRFGMINSPAYAYTAAPGRGLYIRYDSSVDTNWMFVSNVGGVETATSSGVAVSTSFVKVRIRMTTAGHVLFSINGGAETDVTTAIAGSAAPRTMFYTRTTAAKILYWDFLGVLATTSR